MKEEDREAGQVANYRNKVRDALSDTDMIRHWGDGNCGWLIAEFMQALSEIGYTTQTIHTEQRKPINSQLRWDIFKRDGYKCGECGSHRDLTIDHIIPVVRGGDDSINNLRTLCRTCNASKGARILCHIV